MAFTENDENGDVFEFARRWKSRQLLETGHKDLFASPKNIAFFDRLRERKLLTSSTVRVAGRLAAVWLGFIYEGGWSGWIFTYDPEFRKYSVGHQLINFMMERSHQLKHREFDFSIGAEDYKFLYATHVRVVGTAGRLPMRLRILAGAKKELKERSPGLWKVARSVKRELNKFDLRFS